MELPFTLETDLERRIAADPEWQEGVAWGVPRFGHLEGAVMYHIADVLANIEKQCVTAEERAQLRLLALVHDTFKYKVDQSKPAVGHNHHGSIARRFAERYIQDTVLLEIIELHDEAYNSWRLGHYKNRWPLAEERAERLLQRLGSSLPLYVRFFHADSTTDSKDPAPMLWFEQFLKQHDLAFPLC